MNAAIQLGVLGLATGSLYALSALGLLVVYRSSGVLNLANGAFAMLAGYLTWSLRDEMGLPTVVAVAVALAASGALSLTVFLLVVRPLAEASTLTRVVATLAVYIVVQSVVQLVYGPFNKVPTSFLPTRPVEVAGVTIGLDQLIIMALTTVVTAILWAAYRYTRFGIATTAVSENPRALAALGRDVDVLRAVNWVVAGLLAGLAGVLIAPITQLTPVSFLLFLVPSLAAAVLGGMRSFPVTLVAGMLTGAAQVLGTRYVDVPGVRDVIPFAVIIVVLVLLGRSLPGRSFVSERLPRVGSGEIRVVPLLGLVVAVIVLSRLVFDDSLVIGTVVTCAVALIALSQVVITGYAGQLSLAQISMAGIGALVAARVVQEWQVSLPVAMLIGAVAVIPVGVLVGLPALRARGATLAIATLGFGVAIDGAVLRNADLNGGAAGIVIGPLEVFGISLNPILEPRTYLTFVLVVLVLASVAVANLRRGRAGRRLLAIRTNERAAAALGVNVTLAKLYAFTLAAFIAALGGTLLLFRNPSVIVSSGFDVFSAISIVAFTVLGGVGYVGGAVFAGGFNLAALPAVGLGNVFSAFDVASVLNTWMPLIGGVALLLQLIFQPAGIVDAIVHPRRRRDTGPPRTERPGVMSRLVGTRHARAWSRERDVTALLEAGAARPRALRGTTLRVTGATVRYGAVTALEDVTFEVSPGEVLSIIGPNGAGKTSLMDGITGFAPFSGEVRLGETRVESWAPHRRARAGMVRSFQTLELLEDMTVLDNLRVAGDQQDLRSYLVDLIHPKRGGLSSATVAAISTFKLDRFLSVVPTDLAYGDRRLVAIARAVAAEPSVLLLDEPAAGLSAQEREEVGTLIRRIADEWRIAVLLIEHDVALVRRVSDRVVALEFGRQITSGTAEEVLAHPRVVEAYLGAPAEVEALEDEVGPSPHGHAPSEVVR